MIHTFEVPFKGSAESIIAKAKSTIENANGIMNGDKESGDFNIGTKVGKVEGSYLVKNQNLVVTITKKPIIAPASMIEDALRKYLA